MVGGAHGVDDHIGEGAGVEALQLNVVAERREVAIQCAQLAAAPVVVGVLRGLDRHLHLRPVRPGGIARILRVHMNHTCTCTWLVFRLSSVREWR